jgi:phage terminase large subunit-like protein
MADHPVTAYARRVVSGDLRSMCNKWEILACQRHLDDLERAGTADFPYVFDDTRADRLYRHFAMIPRLDVPNERIALENWQQFDFGNIFGWVHMATGKRRFKTGYIRIARGHAKTTCAAGVGNYFMLGDALYPPGHPEQSVFEFGPEINIVAVDRQQGARVREDIADMALSVPAFTERLIVKNSYIKNRKRGGKVVVFSKDINNKDGGRPSLVITEEWHAHTTTDIHEVAVSGKGKKAQCLELIITTAGKDAEVKPCYKDDQQYKQVLSGDIRQDDVFVMIREIDDEDDPHDEACWCKANPFIRNDSEYAKNLLDEIRTQHRDAYAANNATKIREWLRTRMNRWQADSETRYMSTEQMAMWDKLAITPSEFTKLTVGVPCTLGADLSKKIDLTATGNVYALPDGRFAIDAHGYMPEAGVTAHEHSDRVPYRDWVRDGWVTATPGNVTDYHAILGDIKNFDGQITEFCFDPYNATHLAQDLLAHWTDRYGDARAAEMVIEIRQGVPTLSEPTKLFRELVMQGKIVHNGNPFLRWCLGNAVEYQDNNENIKLIKKTKDDTQRIDGIAAVIDAFVRASQNIAVIDVNAVVGADDWGV